VWDIGFSQYRVHVFAVEQFPIFPRCRHILAHSFPSGIEAAGIEIADGYTFGGGHLARSAQQIASPRSRSDGGEANTVARHRLPGAPQQPRLQQGRVRCGSHADLYEIPASQRKSAHSFFSLLQSAFQNTPCGSP
jgi:hypothetical protein